MDTTGGIVIRAYKYKCRMNKSTQVALDRQIDLCRELWNAAVEHRRHLVEHARTFPRFATEAARIWTEIELERESRRSC